MDGGNGDHSYTKGENGGAAFASPIRVNSQPGSAIATGTIRGAQFAIGKSGRVHVAWNGSDAADPRGIVNPDSGKPSEPMLYARLNDRRSAFDPQRNLMKQSFGLDGGGSIAADGMGNVLVTWHGIAESEAKGTGKTGEARRRVWITRSQDDGRTFAPEARAWGEETGACGCCGMRLFASRRGDWFALYRSATESVHRDIYLLRSRDQGQTFQGRLLHKWDINACPMSSMDFAESGNLVAGAWETGGQVYWSRFDGDESLQPIPAPGDGGGRKHPRLAVSQSGEVLLAWTEGTGWQKGGSLAWQVFDRTGKPTSESGRVPGIPTWSFAAVAAQPGGAFTLLY